MGSEFRIGGVWPGLSSVVASGVARTTSRPLRTGISRSRVDAASLEPNIAQRLGDVTDGMTVGQAGDAEGGRLVVEGFGPGGEAHPAVLAAHQRVEFSAALEALGDQRRPDPGCRRSRLRKP